ncbi:hypothetical protein BC831DRAFT_130357 [Entophlyctis helioformis]|nr:hypothetical protein BC831DRAFT_130357 [Entophlyctis helioformis]
MKAITDAQGQLQSARVQQAQQMEASLKRSNDSLSQTLHTLLGFRRLLVKDLVAVYRIRKIQKRYNNNSSSAGNTGSNGNSSNGISNASDQRPPISAVSMTRHSTAGPTGGTDTQADAPRQQTHSQTEQHPQGQSSLGSLSLLVMQGLASLSQVAQQHVTGIAAPQPIRAVAASGARHEERLAKPLTRPATDTTRAAPGMEHHIEYRVVHVGFTIYGNLASLSCKCCNALTA